MSEVRDHLPYSTIGANGMGVYRQLGGGGSGQSEVKNPGGELPLSCGQHDAAVQVVASAYKFLKK